MTSPKSSKSKSASEVAQDTAQFAVWAAHHGCSQALLSDLPSDMEADVHTVFDVSGRIPLAWVTETSEEFKNFNADSPKFHKFLKNAYKSDPRLFLANPPKQNDLREKLASVYNAWKRMTTMSDPNSKEKYTEADYAGQVYNHIRSPAVSKNRLRLQPLIALPRPPIAPSPGSPKRILAARKVKPDAAVFVSSKSISKLSDTRKSPYNTLLETPGVPRGKFPPQATLADHLPDKAGFEFASSVWEDKKPDQSIIDDAWRQNRMATAAAARQHHAFDVKTPVIGLVWGEGTVRAHVDWPCEENGHVKVYSAPYPMQEKPEERRESGVSTVTALSAASGLTAVPDFHTWALKEPAAILAVYFLVRNIDEWTCDVFVKRVKEGVARVARGKVPFVPWRPTERDGKVATKSPVEENAAVVVKKGPDSAKLAKPSTRTRSGLRPRK